MPSSLMKICPRTHEITLSVVLHPLKLHGENVLKRQLLAVVYSISLKLCTEFQLMTHDAL